MVDIDYDELIDYCVTEQQRQKIRAFIECGSQLKAARHIGCTHSKIKRAIDSAKKRKKQSDAEKSKPFDAAEKLRTVKKKARKKVSRYLITNAQNATPVFEEGLKSLKVYCEHNDSELIVIPNRYKNPTSVWAESDESHDWYDHPIVPYLLDHRIELNDNLVILGDIRVIPTAVRPTSGLETLAGSKSAIIGHPKLELVTIPTPQRDLPKVLMTTGTITQRNYTESKTGKKGEHHHTYGAIVVEVCGDAFYFRNITMSEDGSFYDLDNLYTKNGVEDYGRAPALVLGDLHTRYVDEGVVKATFDSPKSITKTLRPQYIVFHDMLDFYSRNHHHRGKVFTNLAKSHSRGHIVEDEVQEAADFVDARLDDETKAIFVPSNHPDALARWIEEADWKTDPDNSIFYLETALMMAKSATMSSSGTKVDCPFSYWMNKKLKRSDQCEFPDRDESCTIEGIEVGFHGDKGPNGARGSINGFGKIGVKSIIGHSHTPGIRDGVFQVGTSSKLQLEYNTGPSSWLHCHAIIYPNGKRSLVTIIDGKWRG